jgi:uncharacterized membrane protein YbhN (UPF0104 family)
VLVAQVVLTFVAFAYLLSIVDTPALLQSLRGAALWSVPTAVATLFAVLAMGALRWSWLIRAYGAERVPPFLQLFHLQTVGLFYNLLPGAVGGDVVRGLVSREAFGPRGAMAGVAVVFVERVVGLLGLILLVSGMLLARPMPALDGLINRTVLWLGLLAAVGALAALAVGRRLAVLAPRRIAELLAALPSLTRPGAFCVAVAISVGNQALVGLVGHAAIAPLAPAVSTLDSLVLSPIAFAAVFFPLTVAGAGTRDAAMVVLYGTLGVGAERAMAASLQILLTYLVVAGSGGLSTLLFPLSRYTSAGRDARSEDADVPLEPG